MSGVRAVLFDAGNTLVYLDRVRLVDMLAGLEIATTEGRVRNAEFAARHLLHDRFGDGYTGTEPEVWHEYFVRLLLGSGVPKERLDEAGKALRDVHRVDHLWTGVEEGTVEALETLASMGLRLAVISNADGRMEAVIERCGLRRHFEFVLDSDRVGVEKPDPAIFHKGCEALGEAPEACLYVGDLYPVDYVGATNAGLRAVLLDPLRLFEGRAPRIDSLSSLPDFLATG